MIQSKEEIIEFLKDRTLMKVLDLRVLEGISGLFQELHCGPGHIVFNQGDESDAIYFISEGSVEVIQSQPGGQPKTIAYLTSGDCFGEMGIVHDTTRNATIRVPEEAAILRLSRKAFTQLQSHFPELTKEVTKLATRRQSSQLPFSSPGLQGNLAFFDLPTVIQTVAGSRQTGVLSLRGRGGKLLAQVNVRQGRLVYVSFLHLTGEAAIFELLTRNEPLDFLFEQQQELDPSIPVDRALSALEPYKLLMEGARRADELPKLMMNLDWPNTVYAPHTAMPEWAMLKGEWVAIARKMWFLLEAGLTLQQLSQKLPYDRYTVLNCLQEMANTGLVRSEASERPVARVETANPTQLAEVVNAINAVSLNLSAILGKDLVKEMLTRALAESAHKYTNLASLSVRPDAATLDLRMAKPDVSQSEASFTSLKYLTRTFLRMASEKSES